MNKLLLFVGLIIASFGVVYAQNNALIINNNAHIVLNGGVAVGNGAYLVINQPHQNGIITTGGGRIQSEAEFNMVRWNIGTNTGTYTVPFYHQPSATPIPYTLQITAAGAGTGRVDFSTYGGAADNNTYRPTDVTHMFDYNTGSVNNSLFVTDRFWIVDAGGYTTRPSATMTFTYRDPENAAPNTIVEANLGAQRFNSGTGQWGDYLPQGTVNTVANTVSAVPVISANFFRSWTLSDINSPLPIELISFEGECKNGEALLTWITATENNNSHFEIEKSADGIVYSYSGKVDGAGNSMSPIQYQFADYLVATPTYFRLVQVDFDGARAVYPPVAIIPCTSGNMQFFHPSGTQMVVVTIDATKDDIYHLRIFDAVGKLVLDGKTLNTTSGLNRFEITIPRLASGMYHINVFNNHTQQSAKIVVTPY
ncbi:MAG: T9SS type A sorting domain-containing protein [Flavobacteriales bacterium]